MADGLDLARLESLLDAQQGILVGVACGDLDTGGSDPGYRRLHGALGALLRPIGDPCFCRWDSVWSWWAEALEIGDPAWREYLFGLQVPNRALLSGLPFPSKYRLGRWRKGGNKEDQPFTRWFIKLDPDKQVATDRALKRQLAVLGSEVTHDQRMGRWITRSKPRTPPKRVLEFKVQGDASDLPPVNADGTHRSGGYPKREIQIRVYCCFSADDTTIVMFDGFDKGVDPNGEDRAIDAAFTALNDYRAQEDRARKIAARTRSA